jgi:dephospho-CoA kinase
MMSNKTGFVGVVGYSGSGKTTAVDYLVEQTRGERIYLGDIVLRQVRERGLPEGPESERKVRLDLRAEKGPAALAHLYADDLVKHLENGVPVFIDAIFTSEELKFLRSRVPTYPARLLAINASFDVRSSRVANRGKRPLTPDELLKRDDTERNELKTNAVIAGADYKISNEQTFEDFYSELADFLTTCG